MGSNHITTPKWHLLVQKHVTRRTNRSDRSTCFYTAHPFTESPKILFLDDCKSFNSSETEFLLIGHKLFVKLDGCIVWNAHNTVLGEEAHLIYIVPVCYVKQVRMERASNIIISVHQKFFSIITNIPLIIS